MTDAISPATVLNSEPHTSSLSLCSRATSKIVVYSSFNCADKRNSVSHDLVPISQKTYQSARRHFSLHDLVVLFLSRLLSNTVLLGLNYTAFLWIPDRLLFWTRICRFAIGGEPLRMRGFSNGISREMRA